MSSKSEYKNLCTWSWTLYSRNVGLTPGSGLDPDLSVSPCPGSMRPHLDSTVDLRVLGSMELGACVYKELGTWSSGQAVMEPGACGGMELHSARAPYHAPGSLWMHVPSLILHECGSVQLHIPGPLPTAWPWHGQLGWMQFCRLYV